MKNFFRIVTAGVVLSLIYVVYSLFQPVEPAKIVSTPVQIHETPLDVKIDLGIANKVYQDMIACFQNVQLSNTDSIFKTMQFNGDVLKNFELTEIRKMMGAGEDFGNEGYYALAGMYDQSGCLARHPGIVRDFNLYGLNAIEEVNNFKPNVQLIKRGEFIAHGSNYYWNLFSYKDKHYLLYEAVSGKDYLRWSFIIDKAINIDDVQKVMASSYFSNLTLEPAAF